MTLDVGAAGAGEFARSAGSVASLVARVTTLSQQVRIDYDTRPISRAEWDAAAGDEA